MMHWSNGMGWWGMLFMSLSTLVFLGLIVAGVVLAALRLGNTGKSARGDGRALTPEQILADRYARGDIDEAEYAQRLQTLRSPTSPPAAHR